MRTYSYTKVHFRFKSPVNCFGCLITEESVVATSKKAACKILGESYPGSEFEIIKHEKIKLPFKADPYTFEWMPAHFVEDPHEPSIEDIETELQFGNKS